MHSCLQMLPLPHRHLDCQFSSPSVHHCHFPNHEHKRHWAEKNDTPGQILPPYFLFWCRYSPVDSFVPTILSPRVRVPSTPCMLFVQFVLHLPCENNKKETEFGPLGNYKGPTRYVFILHNAFVVLVLRLVLRFNFALFYLGSV